MNHNDVKDYLFKLKQSPEMLDDDLSKHQITIDEVIRAEKKYLYGLERTTDALRLEEIEKIILSHIESVKDEN